MERLLSTLGAGRMLNVTSERVRQLERAGTLTAIRDSSGRRLFRECDVLKLRDSREQTRRARQPRTPATIGATA